MVFQINSCIYIYIYIHIYIYILVTRCDGSQKEMRSTPHHAFTFETTTAVFIELHMVRHFFLMFFSKTNSQPHASLHYKKTKTTKLNTTKHMSKQLCKTCMRPKQFQEHQTKMYIETCSPLQKMLIRLWKFNIDRNHHHMFWSQTHPKSFFRGITIFAMFNVMWECFEPYIYIYMYIYIIYIYIICMNIFYIILNHYLYF